MRKYDITLGKELSGNDRIWPNMTETVFQPQLIQYLANQKVKTTPEFRWLISIQIYTQYTFYNHTMHT